MEKLPIVVNVFGAPGAGKSTTSAYVFSALKMADVNCELVREYAKDKVWENNKKALFNGVYVFAKQQYRMAMLEGEVDVVITDAPLINCVLYNNDPELGDEFNTVILRKFQRYENLNFFVRRVKKYNPIGRYQDEAGSDKLGEETEQMLIKYGIPYTAIDGNLEGAQKIVDIVRDFLK